LQALSPDGQPDFGLLSPAMKLTRASLVSTRAGGSSLRSQSTGSARAATAHHLKSIADRERAGRTCVEEGMGMNPGWQPVFERCALLSTVVQTSAMRVAASYIPAYETMHRERMRGAGPACKL